MSRRPEPHQAITINPKFDRTRPRPAPVELTPEAQLAREEQRKRRELRREVEDLLARQAQRDPLFADPLPRLSH
ncbi:hypothetical protein [Deefgea piscis]|uniref:hypothetical protein n=1 Tax=Deefgea piscis TaxID=2739061 RepID=UPI001C7E72AE|nr:hypothetical protein [Deefgea piscis]QZA80877.1 hypothetical protein K4H25_15505 [Deefgea piscis]